ncbi:uncharacterized protein MELLADRAFT_92476 [Melampsora larici-populina 98AG31]|uniref:Uncharacterized protein n=1 Tax=Melampsora larici-populina (strain 98AG31 / pathotype 3-4-7) TaxID=747676 RepID=F4R8L0_MELLP|nr:uncharacterized protein MELLADRAFT_92476 [Melampsora larici-populina 98AG31]EGG11093.1 hypothetical protein MELLADRAFT_92476 [Melampsora larici-populina 98AG31]
MRHHAHPYQMCNSLCAKSSLHEPYSHMGYNGLQGGTCICSNSLPNESYLVEDVHCRKHECADHNAEQCVENDPRLVYYWAVLPENQPNLAVSLDSSTSVQRKIYKRGMNRRNLLRSVIARDVSDPPDQAVGEPDQITTESGASKSFDPSPNSIFSGQTISQTATTDPVPIVAVAMACISLGLGVFCLLVAFNRLNQLRRHQKEHPEPILPEINNTPECTNTLTRKESLQEELSVDILPSSAHPAKQLLMLSQQYRQTTRAGFSPMTSIPGRGTLKDGVRTGKASYVTQHGEFPHEMNANEFIESQYSPHDFKDVPSTKKPFEVEADHLKPLKNRRILDIQASHGYLNQTGTNDYFGSNAIQERHYPSKVDLLSSPTNSNVVSKSPEFMNARNVCGTGPVVSPEKLARESYPHPNIVASGTKGSSITPITRNSWMMKHPQSLKLKESITNCSLSSSSEPQPVRKLKVSFGVGLETDRLDVTAEVPDGVEKSPLMTDYFNLGSSLSRNQSCVSKPDILDSGISGTARGNRLTLDLDEYKRFSSSSRLATLDSPTVTSHHTRSDSNSNILPFPSRETLQSNEKHFLNQSTPYPSLGLPKLSENDTNSTQYPPVKSTPKMNGLLNFGNMLSNFTHSPSSKSKIETETNSEEDFKRTSTCVHPKLNWSRRRKIISGNWKRLNSMTTPTRSPLTSSISSDALSQGYLKKGHQAHSDLNHSLKAYADSSYEVKQERLRNRHKYSKSVPDMSFLSQLHSDDDNDHEPKQLNIMNPDQPSLSDTPSSFSPCELQEGRKTNSLTSVPFHHQFPGNHRNSEDYSTLSSSSGNTAIKKTDSIQVTSMNLNRFLNHLGYEEFKTQLGIIDSKGYSSGGYCRKSDPILYGKWSEAMELYRQKHLISSKSCGNLLSKSLFQTCEKDIKPTLEIQTPFFKNQTLNSGEDQGSDPKNQAFRHPIYNLPMLSRPDHSKPIDKRENPINSMNHTNPILSDQTSSQESYRSAQPGTTNSSSQIHTTNPSTPIFSSKPNQRPPHHQHHHQEEDESIPFFSRPRSSTSILKLTDRHLSLGGISCHSSEDLSSFCTGAASLNSEPQWKSRLNSVGSFATNQSFEGQQKLWVANPDRFYSPSLESIFHSPSRLSLSPVPGLPSASVNS